MGFVNRLTASVIGFDGYRRLWREPGGFGHLALWILVLTALAAGWTFVRVRAQTDRVRTELAAAPDFGLRGGQVYYNGKQPLQIREGNGMIIIDTTGRTGEEALRNLSRGVLVTRDAIYEQRPGTTRRLDLGQLRGLEFTRQDLIGLIGLMPWLLLAGYVFVYLWWLGVGALLALAVALVAGLYAGAARREVPFGQAFRLACYALTLPMALAVLPVYFRGVWWVVIGVALAYGIGGIHAALSAADDGGAPV